MLRHLASRQLTRCSTTSTQTLTYIPARVARASLSTSRIAKQHAIPSLPGAESQQEIDELEQDTPELSTTPSWSIATLLHPPKSTDTSSSNAASSPPPSLDHILSLARLDKPSDPKRVAQLEQDLVRMATFLNHIHIMACTGSDDGNSTSTSSNNSTVDWTRVQSLVSIVDDGSGLQTRPSNEGKDEGSEDVGSGGGGHKKKLSQQDEQDLIKHRQALLVRAKHSKGNFFVVQTGNKTTAQE